MVYYFLTAIRFPYAKPKGLRVSSGRHPPSGAEFKALTDTIHTRVQGLRCPVWASRHEGHSSAFTESLFEGMGFRCKV